MGRCDVNVIIPDLVVQRAQILTWPHEQKREFLKDHKIGWVINFWTKVDPDMADTVEKGYLYIPLPSSFGVMDPHIEALAEYLVNQITPESRLLILCEAGKTRSVYFAALMLRAYHRIDGKETLERINELVPSHRLKWQMEEKLGSLS